jgi:hypothetical protein
MTLIEIDSWNDAPSDVPMRVFKPGTLEDALQKFKALFGYDCKVVFHLRDQWICVVDKEFRMEVKA